jgi:hypothetical protein
MFMRKHRVFRLVDGPWVHRGQNAYLIALLNWRCLSDNFSLVKQFPFTGMSAMANVYFTGGAVLAQRHFLSLVMRPSLGAALLGMSSFWIWHISLF